MGLTLSTSIEIFLVDYSVDSGPVRLPSRNKEADEKQMKLLEDGRRRKTEWARKPLFWLPAENSN